MAMFKWQPGRLGTGYRKLLLASVDLLRGYGCDLWIIDYPIGSCINLHRDPVEGKKHFRANLLLTGSPQSFVTVRNHTLVQGKRLNVFRPDVEMHAVKLSKTRRVVLSLGWVTPNA